MGASRSNPRSNETPLGGSGIEDARESIAQELEGVKLQADKAYALSLIAQAKEAQESGPTIFGEDVIVPGKEGDVVIDGEQRVKIASPAFRYGPNKTYHVRILDYDDDQKVLGVIEAQTLGRMLGFQPEPIQPRVEPAPTEPNIPSVVAPRPSNPEPTPRVVNDIELTVGQDELRRTTRKIWDNESEVDNYEGLTMWNGRETFGPSLGIGHFIWYFYSKAEIQQKKQEGFTVYDESFPALVGFIRDNHPQIHIPSWLLNGDGVALCPWRSKSEFDDSRRGRGDGEKIRKMGELKTFLRNTIPQQGDFMRKRANEAIDETMVLLQSYPKVSEQVEKNLRLLLQTEQGRYAVVDYVQTKGKGTDPEKDRIQHHEQRVGWGFYQVLLNMAPSDTPAQARENFADAAYRVLVERRIDLQPEVGANEAGWTNRINSYSPGHRGDGFDVKPEFTYWRDTADGPRRYENHLNYAGLEPFVDFQHIGAEYEGCIKLADVSKPSLAKIVKPRGATPLFVLGGKHGVQYVIPGDDGEYVDISKPGRPRAVILDGYLLVTSPPFTGSLRLGTVDGIPENSPIRKYTALITGSALNNAREGREPSNPTPSGKRVESADVSETNIYKFLELNPHLANGGCPGHESGDRDSEFSISLATAQIENLASRGYTYHINLLYPDNKGEGKKVKDAYKAAKATYEFQNPGKKFPLKYLSLYVSDYNENGGDGNTVNTPGQRNTARELTKLIRAGEKLYIHCRHGTHRAPIATVLALVGTGQVDSYEEALSLAGLDENNFKNYGYGLGLRQLCKQVITELVRARQKPAAAPVRPRVAPPAPAARENPYTREKVLAEYSFLKPQEQDLFAKNPSRRVKAVREAKLSVGKRKVPRYFQEEDLALERDYKLVKHIVVTKEELKRLCKDKDALDKIQAVYPDYPKIVCVKWEKRSDFQPYDYHYFFRDSEPKDVCIHMTAGHDHEWLVGGQDGSGKRYRQIQDVLYTNGLQCRSATPEFCSSLIAKRTYETKNKGEQIPDNVEFGHSGVEIVRHIEKGNWGVLPDGTRLRFGQGVRGLTRFAPPTDAQIQGFEAMVRYRNQRKLIELGMEEELKKPAHLQKMVINITDSYNGIPRPWEKTDMHTDFAIFAREVTEFLRTPAETSPGSGEYTDAFKAMCRKLTGKTPTQKLLKAVHVRQQVIEQRRNRWLLAAQRAFGETEFLVDNLIPSGTAYDVRRVDRDEFPPTARERLGYGGEKYNRWLEAADRLTEEQQEIMSHFQAENIEVNRTGTLELKNLPAGTKLHQIFDPNLAGFCIYSPRTGKLRAFVDQYAGQSVSENTQAGEWSEDAGLYVDIDTSQSVEIHNGDIIFPIESDVLDIPGDLVLFNKYLQDLALAREAGMESSIPADSESIPSEPVAPRVDLDLPERQNLTTWERPKANLSEEEKAVNAALEGIGYVTEAGAIYFTDNPAEQTLSVLFGDNIGCLVLTGMPRELYNTDIGALDRSIPFISSEELVIQPGDILFPSAELYEAYDQAQSAPVPPNVEPPPTSPEINSPHLVEEKPGVYRVEKTVAAKEVLPPGPPGLRFRVERKSQRSSLAYKGNTVAQWDERSQNYINFEFTPVTLKPGDKIDLNIPEQPFAFTSLQRGRLYKLPDHMRLFPRHMPEEGLSKVEITPAAQAIVDKFPKPYNWGALRMAKNLASRGVEITPDMPLMVTDLSSKSMAFYNPKDGQVVKIPIAWSHKRGLGNTKSSYQQMLGTSQLGAVKYAGYGEVAAFGKQETIKGTNIERIGLEVGPARTLKPGQVPSESTHSYDTSFGNHNSYSLNVEGKDNSRGTSIHGITKWRVTGGSTGGCVGMYQEKRDSGGSMSIKEVAQIVLEQRSKGINGYEETQY